MKELIAVRNKIIVELDITVESKTESGLFIPETATGQPQKYGKVISVGQDVKEVSVGDTIMFLPKMGMDIIVDRKIYKVLCFEDIYGIVKETE